MRDADHGTLRGGSTAALRGEIRSLSENTKKEDSRKAIERPANIGEGRGSSPFCGTNFNKRWRLKFEWARKLGLAECPYLIRWVFSTPFFSIRLHHWKASDDGRHFHDHPWWFVTLVLRGSYVDVSPSGHYWMLPGSIAFRPALHRHTVEVSGGGCWTLVLTGPEIRFWGFWVRNKFRKANKYFLTHGHHPCN